MIKRLILFTIFNLPHLLIVVGQTKYNTIPYEYIEFEYRDSLLKKTLFFEPNDYIKIVDGYVNRTDTTTMYRFEKKGLSIDKYELKTNKITKLQNYFPSLIISDTLILNHYDFELNKGYLPDDNIYYSYILNSLHEPLIINGKVIRIINCPNNELSSKGIYSVYRFNIIDRKFYYTRGQSNANGIIEILLQDSVVVNDRQYGKFIKALENCDFKGQKYYEEIGPDYYDKYFVEYYNHENIFILKMQWSNKYFRDVFISLLNMRNYKK